MMKPLSYLLITFLSVTLLSAASTRKAAILTNVEGDVTVQRYKEASWVRGSSGLLLYEGDTLKTANASRASLAFLNGNVIKVNEGSEFSLEISEKIEDTGSGLFMKFGQLFSKVMRRQARFSVNTPVATIAVRGTEFDAKLGKPKGMKKVKIKVKRSMIGKKGREAAIAEAKKEYEAAMAKARAARKEAEEAARLAEEERRKAKNEKERKQAEEEKRKAEEAKRKAEEAARLAEEERKKAEERAKKGGVEEEKEVQIPDQKLFVNVFEGLVNLANPFGEQNVGAGQSADVQGGSPPAPPQKMEEPPRWHENFGKGPPGGPQDLLEGATTPVSPDKIMTLEVEDADGKKQKIRIRFKKE